MFTAFKVVFSRDFAEENWHRVVTDSEEAENGPTIILAMLRANPSAALHGASGVCKTYNLQHEIRNINRKILIQITIQLSSDAVRGGVTLVRLTDSWL